MKEFLPKLLMNIELLLKSGIEHDHLDDTGKVILSSSYYSKLIAHNLKNYLKKEISPSLLHSSAILNRIFEYIIYKYDNEINLNSIDRANTYLIMKLDSQKYLRFLEIYYDHFPLKEFFKNKENKSNIFKRIGHDANLVKTTISNLIIVNLNNFNAALSNLKLLFDDKVLKETTQYEKAIDELESFFREEKPLPEVNVSLFDFLKEPIIKHPTDIEAQLNYIKENWRKFLPLELIESILKTLDLIEEEKKIFQNFVGVDDTKIPKFSTEELFGLGDKFGKLSLEISHLEPEKFTPDTDWMPKVVLLAKNIYVWLYQLSKKYNREIKKLDQIPDEELHLISSYNINALWLIGIWERSSISQKIKRLTGNPEALASAYSIYDYEISSDLGGEEAFQNLNKRCKEKGIRLACDIVPNHMGIYSKWIIDHTDYFIQTDFSPFPNYSFNGPDLSDNPDFQIRIEDGYWTRRDAAVVYQLIENKTGRIRYIYHGNDGTNMPWNDTAQLNLLKPDVREALIELIFRVAEKFSIIRLDAAMTLTQKHFQRLWFPLPGTGGAIPSRADFSISAQEFYKLYPKEFWREVVDRMNERKSDTLLLAEAFWLLEGYFVRTLGMHRVYNSAFMNMLKKEENSKYRELIKNTLEFNPQILKRYVNFLSNPDEETAINQFGDGDKYFGCTVLMVTMPGLPMFAHGQIEGLREKYGHEYYRVYYDEQPNQYLIERHKKEIFPLLKKRYLFSEVDEFQFFDFYGFDGEIIEDIFAYTNRKGEERALIFYNNSFSTYYGFIQYSCLKNYGRSEGEKDLKSFILGEALGLKNSQKHFYLFRELRTDLEFLMPGSAFYKNKFEIILYGYDYKVFTDFIEMYDFDGSLELLYKKIGFAGVRSVSKELFYLRYEKITNELANLFSHEKINILMNLEDKVFIQLKQNFLQELTQIIEQITRIFEFNGYSFLFKVKSLFEQYRLSINSLKRLFANSRRLKWMNELAQKELISLISEKESYNYFIVEVLLLIKENAKKKDEALSFIARAAEIILPSHEIFELKNLVSFTEIIGEVKKLIHLKEDKSILELLDLLLKHNYCNDYLGVNEFMNEKYFVKENFERLIKLLFNITLMERIKLKIELNLNNKDLLVEIKKIIKSCFIDYKLLIRLSQLSRYRYSELINLLATHSK